jgi:CubicO group peptidase (beta-lactamase class C family)
LSALGADFAAAPIRPATRWTCVDQTRTVELGTRTVRYFNLGFELLGHALARAAGTTYAELADDRVVAPLGLDSMYVPTLPSELRATALAGTGRHGDRRATG